MSDSSNVTKVLFVNRYFFPDHSATSQMLADLAFHLAGRGLRVVVVTSRLRYDDRLAELPDFEVVQGVEVHRVWTSRFGRAFLPGRAIDYLTFYWSAWRCLRHLAGPGDLIVAKTDPPLISVVAAQVARRSGARLVNWLQDLFPEVAIALGVRGLGGGLGRFLVRLRNASLQQAEVNVAIGEGMRARLLAQGVSASAIQVIPNWADEAALAPVPPEENPLRVEWGQEGCFVVGYSGNLGRAHEIETFLGAIRALRDRPEIRFLFIGGGVGFDRLRLAVEAEGLGNVELRPYQPRERLAESLSVADLHLAVLRPEMEGLIVPSKLYGILAVGRPVIFVGDPGGEAGRLIQDAECGFAVGVGQGDEVARRILELLHDPDRRARLGARAREVSLGRHAARAALEAWERLCVGPLGRPYSAGDPASGVAEGRLPRRY